MKSVSRRGVLAGWLGLALLVAPLLAGAGETVDPFRSLADPAVQRRLLAVARGALSRLLGDPAALAGPSAPAPTLPSLRAGVIVTLERRGRVRGCRGTLEPETPTLREEVERSAIAAATTDTRFTPLSRAELGTTRISITVVRDLHALDRIDALLPADGFVVRSGDRVGVVLPFEGRDARTRLEWGRRKAGLRDGEAFDLCRMNAIRFAEEAKKP